MQKKVVVIGGGESGMGAALLAKKHNYEVFLTDAGSIKPEFKKELQQHNIPFEEKGHDFEKLSFANLVIKSPGVPKTATVVKFFENSKVDILSEIEFGYLHYSGMVLAITGSNGKTTASGLLYHLMQNAKYDVALGGNYGISFCRILTQNVPAYMVLEVSSFQLDDCYQFKPKVACILNITPDHLDRYQYDFELYKASKFRIAQVQGETDTLIINGDDQGITSGLHLLNGRVHVHKIFADNYINGITSKEGSIFNLTLKGKHNLFNAAAVVEMARTIGVSENDIATGLSSFKNVAHRLESLGKINDVEYINDSKATNVDATYYAMEAMTSPVVWIAGGTDKGNDYSLILPLVKEKVKALICLGVDNEKLKKYFTPHINLVLETTKVSKALDMVLEIVKPGDIVLLSPASASFDLFKNYEDRGNQFKSAVNALKQKK